MQKVLTEKRIVTEEKEIVVSESLICNKCGKESIKTEEDYCFGQNYQNINLSFGYGSAFDLERWGFDLCDACLLEIVKTFKFVPDGFMQDYTEMCFTKDPQKAFENWKETGEWDEFADYTYEELEELRGYLGDEYIDSLVQRYNLAPTTKE
ncbi:hypothetical protein A616_16405 [Brevibacillus brevis X23]|nr:hypothetical protein A616_16405 [Brevibacillus brevis X23]